MFDEILLGAVIVGIIGEVKRLFPTVTGLITIALSAVLGGVYGFFVGGDIVRGVMVGLGASGLIKAGTTIRG